ncbi:hypothetical protein F4775DRAFT_591045 [Biscogniauxia sp. FL1348]|nr:hypothetical protein F4775DRAFT_591045 [Biscogniauxia sp. FL1348]
MEKDDHGKKKPKKSVNSSTTILSTWRGNLPGVHDTRQGCYVHNSGKLILTYNKRLPSDIRLSVYLEEIFGSRIRYKRVDPAEKESAPIWCNLNIDYSTLHPLDPVHESIPCSPVWRHIDWVPLRKSPMSVMSQLNALACSGTGRGRPDLEFIVEPFYCNKTFPLDQSTQFSLKIRERDPVWRCECITMRVLQRNKWHFEICPHTQHQFYKFGFKESRGLVQADMVYRTTQSGCDTFTAWKSKYGRSRVVWYCPRCCTSSKVKIELVEDEIIVSIRVYNDLRSCLHPFDKNWIVALRPADRLRRYPTYMRVLVDIIRLFASLHHLYRDQEEQPPLT